MYILQILYMFHGFVIFMVVLIDYYVQFKCMK